MMRKCVLANLSDDPPYNQKHFLQMLTLKSNNHNNLLPTQKSMILILYKMWALVWFRDEE
jgi:hypothetical protein